MRFELAYRMRKRLEIICILNDSFGNLEVARPLNISNLFNIIMSKRKYVVNVVI